MPKTYFVILGPADAIDRQLYWDTKVWDWNPDFDQCSKFDARILASPLPEGCTGIIECSGEGKKLETIRFYPLLDLPQWGVPLTL